MQSVYSGDIAADLLKPIDYFSFWLARDLGRAGASFLMRGVTLIVAYAVVYDIVLPGGILQWLAMLLSLLLGILVSFGWRFLVNLAAFWTPNARGIGRFSFGLAWFMSGFLMPLRFFPEWFVRICNLTPFPSMVNTVTEVYLGLLEGPELARALLIQASWAVGLFVLSRLVLRAGVRQLVIQGG
jgi:ABC-2 type transport system permease protein